MYKYAVRRVRGDVAIYFSSIGSTISLLCWLDTIGARHKAPEDVEEKQIDAEKQTYLYLSLSAYTCSLQIEEGGHVSYIMKSTESSHPP